MKKFQLSRYIKKFLPFIIVLCVVLTAAVYFVLSSSQTYVASTVIHYDYDEAKSGQAPDGTALDVNEIKSSAIMTKVTASLGLDEGIYSIDSLLSRVNITEVIDEDEAARKQAVLDNGEQYTEEPTTYIVSFVAKKGEGMGFARRVLDEIINIYYSEFGEKYLNSSSTVNSLSDIYDESYDYIEMMDLIDDNISETLQALNRRSSGNLYFRATTTGLSFADLANEFYYLQDTEVAKLYSRIFGHQITKNKAVLVSDYTERISQNSISNISEDGKINDVLQIIDDYIVKMRESGNTNINHEYILDQVYEKEYGSQNGADHTVTYDKLIYSWRDHTDTREYAVIQSAYYQYLINTFNECKGTCGGLCAYSGKTCAELSEAGYEDLRTAVYEDIKTLVDKLNKYHDLAEQTNAEYNEYLGAKYISTLSSVAVGESVDVKLYTAIAAVFFLLVCSFGATLLGRVNDIIEYMFYTDHLTGFANRVAFDNYLKSNDRKILDDGIVCVNFHILNQTSLNDVYGRDGGDGLIRFVAGIIKEAFGTLDAFYVYNGNSQFVIFVNRTDYITVEHIMKRVSLLLEQREKYTEADIEYTMGLAETSVNGIRKIRALLTKAMSKKEIRVAKATIKAAPSEEPTEKAANV